ncbi:MAG: PDZ domain-containing protein [Micrococcales bacterium]|nr:PDZ domain-containing protein [Micrococcales bacterium]MCL2667380.1 PDZ domain-containing protein [Micrococcales bacterium]
MSNPFAAPHELDLEPAPASPRAVTLTVSMLASACLMALLALLPAPYQVITPGPTVDVLGDAGGEPLIVVSGAKTYPTTGELRLTTVSAWGTPGVTAYPVAVLRGWSSPWSQVGLVVEEPERTRAQIDQDNQVLMVTSQEAAAVAALTELGYDIPTTLTVHSVLDGSGSAGVLEPGDVVLGLDGVPTSDFGAVTDILEKTEPGTTVVVDVLRKGAELHLPVVTTQGEGRALLGINIDRDFDLPVEIRINIDNIGGPSAGTMFALGIIDLLTPEDEAAGVVIAGTGTIDEMGEVGPIGGIRQKMAGARRDGADWFLAPASNCSEVVGHIPSGLHVVSVATLHEAREAVVAIGEGKGSALLACSR